MKPTDWTLYDWQHNPPEAYQKMRQDGPIHWNEDYHGWLVIDYDLARELLKDDRLSSDTTQALKLTTFPKRSRDKVDPLIQLLHSWLMFSDPPYHTAMRKIFNPLFSKPVLSGRAPDIEAHTKELLASCRGEWDFMESFAGILPLRIAFDLFELPYDYIGRFSEWNAKLARFIETTVRSPEVSDEALAAMEQQKIYFNKAIANASPDHFLSQLFTSIEKENLLEKDNYWQMLSMILGAGTETTRNMLGNSIFALLSHPDQYQLLQREPSLLDSAIDECLRFYSPIQSVFRIATEDILVDEVLIKRGHYVRVVLGAINRDPKGFENPDRFDITREPNKHLSFGAGIHFCIGRMLVKLTAQIAFPLILEAFPNLQLVTKDPEWIGGTTFRGIKELVVRC